ncbi:hypothetical protein CBR_g51396 [Chara braunii]|uniref:DUF659 domain-containing protein n=1 Tax=Chara braunii TaxID=69332 RepID=A0A388M8U6_CHABU|nr:hypothetical protein CBR_g51396 [Chara braunii]|eukprot:GBG90889.1 hypothetical protein CBR_g51396 [Chara braunii]
MRAVETHRAQLAEELEEVRQPFWVTGATLLSDGRKSRDGRPIVNFLAAGSRGVVVYTTINREGEADDAVHVLRRWVTIFHEFSFGGPQRINAICTDSACICGGSEGIDIAVHTSCTEEDHLAPVLRPCLQQIVVRHGDELRRVWFLLNPRRRHVRYFSGKVERYDAWLVGQAKRYFLTQTGFELEGAEYILACRQFEDFHIQQGRFGDWGGPEGRARGRAWSGKSETIECASWWSQYGARAPKLQHCALRMMHMWSCASPAERNWAVHGGIHTKKRNQLVFEKVVQLVEITANLRLTEGTTDEEIARQVALITRDPIGASTPPSADAVFDRRACIFRPYPREDDSDEEPIPVAADDPALRIPREINETHEDPDSEETRAQTARRAADRAEREMLGGDEDFWGPFGEVASTGGPEAEATTPTPTRRDSSMPPPPAPSPAPRSPVSPLQPDREELGSSLPQHRLLHRGGAEEGAPLAAAVESSVAPAAVPDATIAAAVEEIATASVLEEMAASVLEEDPPAAGGGATVEGQVVAAGGAGGGAAAVEVEVAVAVEEEAALSAATVEEEIAAQAEVQRGGDDERLMQQFLTEELGPAIAATVQCTPAPSSVVGFPTSPSRFAPLAFGVEVSQDSTECIQPSVAVPSAPPQTTVSPPPPPRLPTRRAVRSIRCSEQLATREDVVSSLLDLSMLQARQERLTFHVAALRRLLAILSNPDRTLPIIPVRLGTSTRVYSALWDSGSQGDFIHPRVVKEARLPTTGSPTPISVTLGDDKTHRFFDQTVTDLPFFLTLEPTERSPASRRHRSSAHFDVMETGYDFILGTPWSPRFPQHRGRLGDQHSLGTSGSRDGKGSDREVSAGWEVGMGKGVSPQREIRMGTGVGGGESGNGGRALGGGKSGQGSRRRQGSRDGKGSRGRGVNAGREVWMGRGISPRRGIVIGRGVGGGKSGNGGRPLGGGKSGEARESGWERKSWEGGQCREGSRDGKGVRGRGVGGGKSGNGGRPLSGGKSGQGTRGRKGSGDGKGSYETPADASAGPISDGGRRWGRVRD